MAMLNNQRVYSDWNLNVPSLQGDQMIIPKKINGILVAPARCFPMKSTNHGKKSHEPHRKKNPIVYKFGKCQIMSMLDIQKPWQKKVATPQISETLQWYSLNQTVWRMAQETTWRDQATSRIPVTGSPGRAQHVEHAQWMRGTGGALRGITGHYGASRGALPQVRVQMSWG